MDDSRVNLEALLLSYYIKYDKLMQMCYASLADISTNSVDIYIDLYDMLKPIYTRDVYANKKFIVVSSIINLAAHLRGYFWTRHRLNTRIFLVYGESTLMPQRQFYPAFGDNKFMGAINFASNNKFIHDQLEMVKILCGYIYDVYYVPKRSCFSMFVYDNIAKNQNQPSIILSKSKYAYQIPALLPNARIFRPKKSNMGDLSYIVSKAYLYPAYYNKITSGSTISKLSRISPSLLSVMMALTGLPSYGVNTLINTSVAAKMLLDAIESNRIINDYNNDIDFVYKALDGIDKYIDQTSFKYRFSAIDLVTQHRIYNSTAEAIDNTWMVNFNDPDTMRDINNKYFIDNPLDFDNL